MDALLFGIILAPDRVVPMKDFVGEYDGDGYTSRGCATPAGSDRARVVSEYLAASPVVARSWCPGCEPSADPLIEILDVHYCEEHTPARIGSADRIVAADIVITGSAEAGGEANRIWCDLIHREIPRRRALDSYRSAH